MDKEKEYAEDICFICQYGGWRIEQCKECLFNILKQNDIDEN